MTNLALESQGFASIGQPSVIIEPRSGHLLVHAANGAAETLGIRSGLKLSAALAISDALNVVERSMQAEQASLESLAVWAHSLTPIVSLEFPDALLLEVQGSTKLFGGIENIRKALVAQIRKRRLSYRLSVAPTANAALWLARHESRSALEHDTFPSALRALPLRVTAWPDAIQSRLEEMGVTTIGECLRLPRDGFAKRIGTRYLHDLDRALGRAADPRVTIDLPITLSYKVDFPSETQDLDIIAQAGGSMIEKMAAALRKAQRQVRSFTLVFRYLHHEPTSESFELIDPDHEKQRFLSLFSDRLERLGLQAPAVALELQTGVLQAMDLNAPDLFADRDYEQGIDRVLVERLRERLGPRSVYGIALAEDHRPEAAWQELAASGAIAARRARKLSPWANTRPSWLLSAPSRLICKEGVPLYGGPIEILAGPERIEGGWWDRQDVRRDYYIASNRRGERLWIYLDRTENAWYLHGVFG